MRGLVTHALLAVAVTVACSTVREEIPTRPDTGDRDAASLIPEAPTPTPTPTPTPLPDTPFPDSPWGGGGGVGDAVGSCGAPTPPPISRFRIGILRAQGETVVLDATPLVGPDAAYCQLVGFTDGRLYCAVRPEGAPDRLACEALGVGRAADTGRIGPTWSANGHPCQGKSSGASCDNHPDNQFLVIAYGAGRFRACTAGGVCSDYSLP
jgi:hypothetical protein